MYPPELQVQFDVSCASDKNESSVTEPIEGTSCQLETTNSESPVTLSQKVGGMETDGNDCHGGRYMCSCSREVGWGVENMPLILIFNEALPSRVSWGIKYYWLYF